MSAAEVIDVAREGLLVLIKLGAPAMLVALGIGLVVSLLQALARCRR